jgi:hypothetical protein
MACCASPLFSTFALSGAFEMQALVQVLPSVNTVFRSISDGPFKWLIDLWWPLNGILVRA